MKLSNSRAVFHIGRTIQNPRNTYNRSSLYRRVRPRKYHGNVQKLYAPDRTPHRHQHRRNKDDVRTYSRQQKQRQHHRSRQSRRRNVPPQLHQHRKTYRVKICNPRASAQTIFVPVWKRAHRKAHQRPHRRNKGGALMFSRQQKQRQHRGRSHRNNRKIITPHQRFRRRKIYHARIRNPHAYVQTIFVPVRKHAHRRAHQRSHHRNMDGAPTFSKQQRQRRRSHQNHRRNVLPQLCRHWKMHRDRHRKHPSYAQTMYAYALNRTYHRASQPQHHKSLDGVFSLRKRQKKLRRHLSKRHFRSNQLNLKNRQPKIYRACAQKTCAHDRTRKSRKVPPRQQRRNRDGAHMCGRQRNPAQKKRLRKTFIQSHQKFALWKIFPSMSRCASVKSQRLRNCAANCHLKQRQRKRRTFGISSRPAHGRRVPLNLLTAV